jgi:photosystem II stability/assembly factor-like uncharacterized protein
VKRFALALLFVPAIARAEGSVIVEVSPAFPVGPYTSLRVDPANPERIAVGTADGHVAWSIDGGVTATESRAFEPRDYNVMILRGGNFRRREYAGLREGRGATRLFLAMMQQGLPLTRWSYWMASESPKADIVDVALPPAAGRMIAASPAGILVSDARRGVWSRALGGPRPKGEDIAGFAVAIDPEDPSYVLAGTSAGLWVSHDGGHTFFRHRDRKLTEDEIKGFYWDPEDPDHILAMLGDGVLQSRDRGEHFEAALSVPGVLHAVALASDGAYVATSKGLLMPGAGGKDEKRLVGESVVGVVPIGDGLTLAATEQALLLLGADGRQVELMRTTASDPIVRLTGTSQLAWLLTRYGIFRVGAPELRAERRVRPPKINLSLVDVQNAAISRLGLPTNEQTRLAGPWYAKLMPTLSVRIKGVLQNDYQLAHDNSLPGLLGYRATASQLDTCCGGVPGEPAVAVVVLAQWDLARIFLPSISNPNSMIESGLRPIRKQVLTEVRWRYRECEHLAKLLEKPPVDPQVEWNWRTRLEEHASYLEAVSGREVVTQIEMEEP